MAYLGAEHAQFLRHLSDGIQSAISREKHFWESTQRNSPRWAKWQKNTQPALIGSGIVTSVALVEHLIGKNNNGTWNIPSPWYGKKEFNNFRIIRHCFAHGAGAILSNRKQELEDFLQRLTDGLVSDRKAETVRPYYALTQTRIIPSAAALGRLRLLATELLAERGLVETWY